MTRMRSRDIAAATLASVLVLTAGCGGEDDAAPAAGGPSTTATSAPATQGTVPPSDAATSSATATAPVSLSMLSGESTTLTIDESFLDALRTLRVDVQPVGGAEVQTAGGATAFVFPVTGGRVSVDPTGTERLSGTVQHQGGLLLSALGRSATIEDLVLDADRGELTAMIGGRRVPVLPVDAADARIDRQGDSVVVTDDAVVLESDAAAELAGQLGLPALPSVELGQLQTTLTGSS